MSAVLKLLACVAVELLVFMPSFAPSAGEGRGIDSDLFNLLGLSARTTRTMAGAPDPILSEKRLSGQNVACTDCHIPAESWSSDKLGPSQGGRDGRAVPGLFGVATEKSFFWDGRATTLEAQVMEVLENPKEMGTTRVALAKAKATGRFTVPGCEHQGNVGFLAHASHRTYTEKEKSQIEGYFYCVAHKLADAVRLIDPPENAWSEWAQTGKLNMDRDSPAYRGALLFVGKGRCATCHFGPTFSDAQFHNIGVGDLHASDISDPGRFGAVRNLQDSDYDRISDAHNPAPARRLQFNIGEEMWGAFKTPSLLGVSHRRVFMHNGKFRRIEDVVHYYNTLEGSVVPPHHYNGLIAPIGLTPAEETDLVMFLKSL